jgi:hypothetical protein
MFGLARASGSAGPELLALGTRPVPALVDRIVPVDPEPFASFLGAGKGRGLGRLGADDRRCPVLGCLVLQPPQL